MPLYIVAHLNPLRSPSLMGKLVCNLDTYEANGRTQTSPCNITWFDFVFHLTLISNIQWNRDSDIVIFNKYFVKLTIRISLFSDKETFINRYFIRSANFISCWHLPTDPRRFWSVWLRRENQRKMSYCLGQRVLYSLVLTMLQWPHDFDPETSPLLVLS